MAKAKTGNLGTATLTVVKLLMGQMPERTSRYHQMIVKYILNSCEDQEGQEGLGELSLRREGQPRPRVATLASFCIR